jgi:drug/metabolite transporter (DMT)-like permease
VALGLAAAFAAALAFGLAAILQGISTAETEASTGLDPRLLLRLLRQPVFVTSLLLNLLGFGLHVLALRSLPLFLAQAAIASSVAVTAVLATRVFEVELTRAQWGSVGAVCLGLTLLAGTAESGAALTGGSGVRWLVLATVVSVAIAGAVVARGRAALTAVLLGLLGGTAYGMVAVSARLLGEESWSGLASDVATYLLLACGAVAYLLYTTAMQRGSVTTTTAAVVVTQTAVPAVVGITLLGDRVHAGLGPLAIVGFLLALGGAAALARFEQTTPVPEPLRRL